MNLHSFYPEGIWISPAVSILKRSPAETLLIGRICQRAAIQGGQCTDGNKDLSEAIGVHPQTVSGLIDRLHKDKLLQAVVDTKRANQRSLTPAADLLADYEQIAPSRFGLMDQPGVSYERITHSQPRPYEPIAHSHPSTPEPSAYPVRICPITQLDISHQQERHRFVTTWTLSALFESDRPAFDQIASTFLDERVRQESRDSQCFVLSNRIQRLVRKNRR